MYPLHGILYFKNEKKEHFQIRSVAPPTCERKQIIAEFMFLDSSKMENLMLSPVAQVCFLELKWELERNLSDSFLLMLYCTEPMDGKFQIMAWCWNHTEAGSNTESTSSFKASEIRWPNEIWILKKEHCDRCPDSEEKLLQTLTKPLLIFNKKKRKVQNNSLCSQFPGFIGSSIPHRWRPCKIRWEHTFPLQTDAL